MFLEFCNTNVYLFRLRSDPIYPILKLVEQYTTLIEEMKFDNPTLAVHLRYSRILGN
jgi:hypothetical protein